LQPITKRQPSSNNAANGQGAGPGDRILCTAKKNAGLKPGRRFQLKAMRALGFGDGDGARGANLDAALTAQALILIDGDRFAVLHLENAHRTNIDAFFIPGALVGVDFHSPGH
jgi:hypothetical protein